MRLTFFLCAALTLCTTVASAQEIIEIDRTPRGEPSRRLNPEETKAEAAGAWAQEVLDRAVGVPAAGAEPERRARCDADPDRAAHGEVWGEVGTGGYRSVGGVVTQPIGACGQLTIGIGQTNFGR